MCGIVGLIGQQAVNQDIYDALTVLQHRGQDAAGIMTCENGHLHLRKGNGLVRDVLQETHMLRLRGTMGIGHVRYPTAGTPSEAEAQPFYVNSPYGIALAHNGNIVNAEALKKELWIAERRHLNTTSDSEVLLNVLAQELQKLHAAQLTPEHIFTAVSQLHKRCIGGYAIVAMIVGYGIVAFRDPHGIRPLTLGQREMEHGIEYMFASESVALDVAGFKAIRDIAPGEAVYVTTSGQYYAKPCAINAVLSPCLFEFVYLSRSDTIIDKILVYKVRLKLGHYLADKIKKEWPTHDIDVVIPIPDTSKIAAFKLSLKLGLKYREGFVKNHYIGRTFIMPGQAKRKKSVRHKLNAIPLEFQGKNVLLVDDSIVRGTTAKEIVQMARDAGAKNVYFASAAPIIKYPNVYGINMPSAQELVAHDRTVDEICKFIGADKLIFQDLNDLVKAAREGNESITRFEDSVFTGDYITGGVNNDYLINLAKVRSDKNQQVACPVKSIDITNHD
ncbi:MAG: amidophosphoribosyltransferase [Legionellales bacterium]|nr:amidophosphoribosyltransferase [Legionellales bacterium]